ncbi:MAG: right-handed parallel beta-helix repeat-containing protein [Planctomycetes bacterium]|nr:right-handed parallel beta-helix repeat-containing protein [Planctomycetota bacterium]
MSCAAGKWLAVAFLGLAVRPWFVLAEGTVPADALVPAHGKYSQTYQGDWANLPTGKQLAKHDLGAYTLKDVKGQEARRRFQGQKKVRLAGERLRVSWPKPECDKYRHTLYHFVNCDEALIEDMIVAQADPDYRASSVFFFEDCGTVTVRNCFLGGTSGRALIRIEGCEQYFIDRVEISGIDYPGVGVRSGPGIFINNGQGWDPARNRAGEIHSETPRNLKWGVIQNSYIHDYPNVVPDTNHDGILFHAPADGLVFNCVFENYEADSCLDISHRRNDAAYQSHLFRLERNIFTNCHRVKTNGAVGSATCAIVWANNLYLNSMLTDYHVGWPNWHLHETFAFTRAPSYFLTMHCRPGGTLFRNCLFWSPERPRSMYEPWGREGEDVTAIEPDHFLYLTPAPSSWLKPRGKVGTTILDWPAWQKAGFDRHSQLANSPPHFLEAEREDFRLLPNSPAARVGTPAVLQPEGLRPGILWDFHKRPRPNPPSVGAFEVAP